MSSRPRRFSDWRSAAARLRLHALMVLSLCLLIVSGCRDKGGPGHADAAAQVVPPPPGLLADVFLSTPDTTYQRLRGKVGGPAALLPAGFPSLVVTLLGLPPQAAEQIDANIPAFGAAVDTAPGREPDVVLAVHLRDEGKLREMLVGGPQPTFDARKDTSGITLIERKVKDPNAFAAMALANNHLLAARSVDALILAGQYVTRTLPTLKVPSSEITFVAHNTALAGPLQTRLRSMWAEYKKEGEKRDEELRKEHGGRAPDFGDPAAALADLDGKVRRLLDIMGDLDEARLEGNTDETGLHSKLLMLPRAGGEVASKEIQALAIGDTAPLLDMPAGSVVALMSRDSDEVRKASAKEQSDGLSKILGERITDDGRKKVGQVLETWASARGEWLGAAVAWGSKEQALVIRGEVKDAAALDKSIDQMFELARLPGLQEPIERVAGKLAFGKPVATGSSHTLHVKREVPSKGGKPERSEFDLQWDTAAPVFRVVATNDAKGWQAGEPKEKRPTLRDEALIAGALKALGNEASFVFVLQPARMSMLLNPRAREPEATTAPVVFSYGRARTDGWFRLDLPYQVLADLTRGLVRR